MTRPTPLPPKKPRYLFWIGVIAAVLATVLLLVATVYVRRWYDNPPAAAIEYPKNPTFTSDDGSVMLTVPDRAASKDVRFKIANGAKHADSIASGKLAFKPIGSPVDILASGDWLMSDKIAVTLKYNPKLIPEGLTAKQVGMVVYDPRLDSWIPILNAKADPQTGTVTALAPHFSWFSAIVLDPLKKVVEVGGRTIETVINTSITVTSWVNGLVNNLAGNIIQDLFGVAPDLKCGSTSQQIEVSASSTFNALSGCVESAGQNDRLRLRNGFAFPMIARGKLPTGMTLESSDIWDNGADLQDLVRSMFWASQGKMYVSGAALASVTVTPDMKQTAQLTMDIDSEAIAFSIGLAVLTAFSPPAAGAKAALKVAADAVAKGAKVASITGENTAWVKQAYDTLDCIVGAAHEPIDSMFGKKGYETAANIAQGCLSTTLSGLNLEGALAEVLSSVKLIPQVIQTLGYGASEAVMDSLPEQFDGIKMKPPTVTITRKGQKPPATSQGGQPSSQSSRSYQDNWKIYPSLMGEWQSGPTVLTIKDWGEGAYRSTFNFCSAAGNGEKLTWCVASGTALLIPGGDQINAYWGVPTAKDKNGKEITLAPEIISRYKGSASIITHVEKGIIVVKNGPLSGEFCDKATFALAHDTSSKYWHRCW